ncbi:MAG: hypothetical protein IJP88_03580, partial [Synergistaceae bacterium]|nr:hypothetical protein [Synergistaceae bacterium]
SYSVSYYEDLIKHYEEKIKDANNFFKETKLITIPSLEGNLYTVDIPENDVLLDWDAGMLEQPEAVKNAVKQMLADLQKEDFSIERMTGGNFYSRLGWITESDEIHRLAGDTVTAKGKWRIKRTDQLVSMLLNKYGIPGLRYLDGGSRDAKDGTHNFVIWNTDTLKIMGVEGDAAATEAHLYDSNAGDTFNQIGRQRKIEMSDALAERRTDLSERQRAETIAEIEKLSEKIKKGGSPKIESAAVNWVLNGHITLPKDNDKIWDAMRVCEQKHLNPLDFKDPNDILVEYTYRLQPDNMRTDPDKVDVFSDKQVLPNGIVTYKVEDSEAGQKAVREVIDTNWGKDANPWCLTAVDREGKFIPSAWKRWKQYSSYDKRIAFLDGHLLAFSANDDERVRWWDKWDNYSGLVPNIITGRLKDESYDLDNSKKRLEIKNGRVRWFRYDEQNSLDVEIDIKSNQATKYFKDGTKFKGNVSELYADFKPKEIVKEIEDKDDKNKKLQTILRLNSDGTPDSIQYADNTFKSWFKNGQIKTERLLDGTVRTYYDNKEHTLRVESLPDKTYREWYESGVLSLENLPDGTQRAWYENGNLKRERLPDFTYREWYENGNKKLENFLDGTVRQWYETGKLKHEQLLDGTHRHWRENGRLWNERLPDGTQREWYENGQKRIEALPNGHSYRWYSIGELEVHNYNGKNLQYSIGYRQDGTRRSSYRSDYGWVDYYENNRPCKTTLLDKTIIEHFRNGRPRHIIHPDGREEFFNSRGMPVERKETVDTLNQVAGERGAANLDAADAQNRLDNLEVAREMEIAGKTAREIKSATGWERGKDTKWRYEIPDGKLKINEEDFKDGYITTLGKLYNSPKLYKAYPELRKLRVYFEHLPFGETAETLLGENIQDIRLIFDPREFYTGGLVHEIQHVIQIIEGFARGGSSDSVLRGEVLKYTNEEYERLLNTEPLSYEDYISTRFFFNDEEAQAAYSGYVKRIKENPERVLRPKAAYNVYNKLSGEVEARNADRRLEYKPRERKNSLLLDTEDVAREDQIAIFNQIAGKRGAANLDAADGQNRLKNLETAREMETAGKTAKEIRYATGWERGADKNWRYEIDDGKFDAGFFDKVQETIKRRFVDKKLFSFRGFSNNAKLGDIYHNPELYKAYPKLKKLKVSFMAYHINGDPVFKGMYIASRFPFSNEILINTVPIHFYKYDLNKVQEILVHEIQHAIQDVEGFAPYSDISAPLNDEYNRRAAEEVEARNAETRLKLTPKDRKEYLLEETEDVAREDQIIIFNQLSKQRRADFTKLLNERRPDLADEGLVESTVEEIDNLSLSDDAKNRNLSPNKVQLAARHWLSNSESLRLPEDGYKILDGLELCNKKKVQYQDITNLNAFLRRFTQKEIDKAVRLNPDTLPEFSNKVEYNIDDKKAGKHKITVYTVQDDKTGQKAVRRVINSHWGEKSNPWCLVRGDDNGNLITEGTASALKYWEQYNGTKKRIAFLDGKLSAFSANEGHDVVWWNSIDWASEGIPFTVKKDKETISFEYREADNKIVPFKSKIDDDTETEYYDNGMPRVIYYPDEVREAFYRTGELLSRFFPEAQDAPQCTEYYFKTGQLRTRQYLDGTFEEFDINGKNISDSMRRFYIYDRLWCEELSDGSKVIYDYDEFDNEYIKGIHRPDGEFITINGLKNLPDGTIQTIRDGQLLSELDPQGITWVYKNGKRVRANSADTLNQIGKVRRTEMAEILNKKRQDLTEDQRADIIDEVERLGEQVKQGGSPNTEKIAFAWAVKGHIILPEDNSKILQAIKIAKQEHIDPLSYDDPNEILAEFAINDELEDAINPDTVPEFTNKQELPNGLTVYDVQDSKEGQLAVRKIINSHFGVDANPWCLAAGDEYGDLTDEAWEYWSDNYEGSKRIAFKDGKLTAFYAEGSDNLWWNRQDKSSSGIPFNVKIPHGTAELLYNEESGEFTKSREVIRLSKDSKVEREFQNGALYREKDFKKVKTKNRDGQEISKWRGVSWRRYDIDTKKIAAEQRPDGNYFAYYDYDTQDIEVHKSPDGTTREYYEGSYGKQLKAEEKPDGTKRR